MGSLLNIGPRESRAPDLVVLPDGRKQIVRYLDIGANRLQLPAELNFAPADPDFCADPPAGWEGLLLTYFKAVDDLPQKGKDSRPILQMTFEQIDPVVETPVGGRTERELPDGRKGYDLDSIEFSFNTFSPGTIGTDTDPDDANAFLYSVEAPDDGTLRKITRTYVYAGELAIDTQTKNNGALSIVTITSAKTVPSTPSGYTLIGQPIQNPNGFPIYTYTYAKGTGEISRQIEFRQSPDQGVNGVTITTIKFLTVPAISVDPTTPPASSTNIGSTHDDADGYRVWTSIYAAGAGVILSEVDTRNGGKLIIYKITSINTAPTTPSATIGGTVALITNLKHNGSRFDSGIVIYEYTWAEGEGQISQETEYAESTDQGANGITKNTIRWLVAAGASVQPTSLAGSALARQSFEDVEGYRIWTTVWGKGAGLAVDEMTLNKIGCLAIYHRVGFGTAPTPPGATLGGTLVQIQSASRKAEGYQIFDYRWAEGNGQSSSTTYGEDDGALVYVVADLGATKTTPAYPGSGTGYLMKLEQTAEEGYYVNLAVYKKPPATAALSRQINNWKYPGFINILSSPAGLEFVPPVDMNLLATETISYGTSQVTTTPFTIKAYATVAFSYVPTNQGTPKQTRSQQKAATGYLSASTGASDTNSTFNGVPCDSWEYSISASTPAVPPAGATTLEVHNDIYLVDITGTIVYRSRVTTFSF